MKKTLIILFALSSISIANAQNTKPAGNNLDPSNMSALQALPKHTRDSLVTELKKVAGTAKKNPVTINGKDMTAQLAAPMKKMSAAVTAMMIDVLQSDDPEVVNKNQKKYQLIIEQIGNDMDREAGKIEYEAKKQRIVDKFKNGSYHDADDKRDARKEMKEDLKELKERRDEDVKREKEDRKRELKTSKVSA